MPDSKKTLTKPLYKKIVIIGVGLMGGSVGAALIKNNIAEIVVGYDINSEHLTNAVKYGCIHEKAKTLKDAVKDADIVIIATHLSSISETFTNIKPFLGKESIIFDILSVKEAVIEASKILGEHANNYVPCHPIAGKETSGPSLSPVKFEGKRIILTPTPTTSKDAIKKVEKIWKDMGAIPEKLKADYHDRVLAATSHFPHIISTLLANTLLEKFSQKELNRFSSTVLQTVTRLAHSNPEMWAGIATANAKNLFILLKSFQDELKSIKPKIDLRSVTLFSQIISTFIKPTLLKHLTETEIKNLSGSGFRSMTKYAFSPKTLKDKLSPDTSTSISPLLLSFHKNLKNAITDIKKQKTEILFTLFKEGNKLPRIKPNDKKIRTKQQKKWF